MQVLMPMVVIMPLLLRVIPEMNFLLLIPLMIMVGIWWNEYNNNGDDDHDNDVDHKLKHMG